jgi:hypothetical protein
MKIYSETKEPRVAIPFFDCGIVVVGPNVFLKQRSGKQGSE